jgi:hypothetical protein
MRSRVRFLDWIDAHPDRVSALYGIDTPEARKRLQSMVIWPMRYPKPIELLVFIVVAALCFICYKFALLLLSVFLCFAIKDVAKIFRSQSPGVA